MCALSRVEMMAPRNFFKFLVGALLSAAAVAACGLEGTGQNDSGYATETEACQECQAILVECTSTSRDEAQFVECRDQWQTCQNGRALGADTCGNPGDTEACDLCRARMNECKSTANADEAMCEQEFGICKAYLITRGDIQQQCTATEQVPPEVACGVCQKDMAVCVSDASLDNAQAVCGSKFEQCVGVNQLSPGQCEAPTAATACNLCTEQHTDCEAAAGPSCEDGFNACAGSIAADVACSLDTAGPGSGGGGAGGGTGEGGAGGGSTGNDCAHDVCAEGVALTEGCGDNTCVDDVCALDSWCCENEWDEFCVQKAVDTPSCGCSA